MLRGKSKVETARFCTLLGRKSSWICLAKQLGASTLRLESLPLWIVVLLLLAKLLLLGASFAGSLRWGFGTTFADVVFNVYFGAVNFTAVNLWVLVIYIWALWHLKSSWSHEAPRFSLLHLPGFTWIEGGRRCESRHVLGLKPALWCDGRRASVGSRLKVNCFLGLAKWGLNRLCARKVHQGLKVLSHLFAFKFINRNSCLQRP